MALDKPKIKVLDTHIHLAVDWKESLGGGKGLPNVWLPGEPDSFQRNFTEKNLLDLNAEGPHNFEIVGTVFVECSNVPAEEEARWTLSMAEDPGSSVKAVVANIPVPNGAAAVRTFLDKLRNKNDGSLPSRLKGGRVVLLGDPMPPPNLCLSDSYLEGLCELQKTGAWLPNAHFHTSLFASKEIFLIKKKHLKTTMLPQKALTQLNPVQNSCHQSPPLGGEDSVLHMRKMMKTKISAKIGNDLIVCKKICRTTCLTKTEVSKEGLPENLRYGGDVDQVQPILQMACNVVYLVVVERVSAQST
eukprot:UC4_evm1s839